jgi:hypothetical protein
MAFRPHFQKPNPSKNFRSATTSFSCPASCSLALDIEAFHSIRVRLIRGYGVLRCGAWRCGRKYGRSLARGGCMFAGWVRLSWLSSVRRCRDSRTGVAYAIMDVATCSSSALSDRMACHVVIISQSCPQEGCGKHLEAKSRPDTEKWSCGVRVEERLQG